MDEKPIDPINPIDVHALVGDITPMSAEEVSRCMDDLPGLEHKKHHSAAVEALLDTLAGLTPMGPMTISGTWDDGRVRFTCVLCGLAYTPSSMVARVATPDVSGPCCDACAVQALID